MRKFLVIIPICVLLVLGGCKFISWDQEKPDSGVGTIDNLVPMGEYAQIGYNDWDVQMKIVDVITGSEARQLLDYDEENDIIIVKFNIKVVETKGNYSPDNINMILKNGLNEKTSYVISASKKLGIKNIDSLEFGAEGEADCFAIFNLNLDDCRCLKYWTYYGGVECYFAVQ